MADNETSGNASLHQSRGRLLEQFLSVIRFTPVGIILGQNPLSNNPVSNKITQGVNDAVRDTVRDSIAGMTWLATDKTTANQYADQVEQFWRNNINRYDPRLGQAEFRKAAGWKLPAGMPYNGVVDPKKDNQEISRMDAVFYRDNKGNIEILDARDPRWTNLVAPYIAAQIMVPTYAAKAVGAAVSAIGNGNKLAQFTAHATTIGKFAGGTHTSGGVGFGGSTVYSNFILKPEAIDGIAHLYDAPQKVTNNFLRAELNTAFDQYSLLNGPMSEQYFVPPIKANESPLKRLQDLSRGLMRGVFISAHPFDRIANLGPNSPHLAKEPVRLNEIRQQIAENLDFQRGFLKLAQRTIAGERLTDQEITLLKFGTGIIVADRTMDLSERPKGYSDKDREQIRKDLVRSLASNYLSTEDGDVDVSKVSEEIAERLKTAEFQIKERDRSKNPIIKNRIDSPFVLG